MMSEDENSQRKSHQSIESKQSRATPIAQLVFAYLSSFSSQPLGSIMVKYKIVYLTVQAFAFLLAPCGCRILKT
jgi:hypothetical protein